MKVRDLERELVLGQKWAVECELITQYSNGESESDFQTYEYVVGGRRKCPFLDNEINSIRVINNVINVFVTEYMKEPK